MKLLDLEQAVRQHSGEFLCEGIHNNEVIKVVRFEHVVTPPVDSTELPPIGRLQDFYGTFGSIVFYYDKISGDAAKYIAPTSTWNELHPAFNAWFDSLDDDERSEILPEWIGTCLVIGESPRTGNYILMPTSGAMSGYVFEFDHDGFEFTEAAKDLVEYAEKLLVPDESMLLEFASHMRFPDESFEIQWWIRQFSDNQGRILTTTDTN